MTKYLLFLSLAGVVVCFGDEVSKPAVEAKSEKKPVAEADKSSSDKPVEEKKSSDPAADSGKASKDKAAQQQAAAVVRALVKAVGNFELDYDYLPSPASAVKGADCNTDTSAPEQLIAILTGMSKEQNSRKKHYLGDVPQAKVQKGKAFGGLYRETEEEFALYDPWGNCYRIVLDLDADGKVQNPNTKPPDGEPEQIKKSVIAWSCGPDGKEETWDDNICSWK